MKIISIKKDKAEIKKKIEPFNIYLFYNVDALIYFSKNVKKEDFVLNLDSIEDMNYEDSNYNWKKIKKTNLIVLWVFSIRNLLLIEKGFDFMNLNIISDS